MFPRLPLCVSQSPGPLLQGRRKDPVLEPAFPPLRLSLLCPAALGNTHRILAGDRQRTRALWVLQLPHRELAWVTDLTLTPESSPSTRQAVAPENHACWLRAGPGRRGAGSPPSSLLGKGWTREGRLLCCRAAPRGPLCDVPVQVVFP